MTRQRLQTRVDIYRDTFGVPHIRARSLCDAFFAQGYVHAQDRFWQMDYDRKRGQGRLSEYLGRSSVAQDVIARRVRLHASSKDDYDALPNETKFVLDAYSDGVNHFLETTTEASYEHSLLGARPEPWQPWDGLSVYKVRHVMMGVWEGKVWRHCLLGQVGAENLARFYPGATQGELLIVPPGATEVTDSPPANELLRDFCSSDWARDDDGGSNNWVVSGLRTASGKPLLAGDPHRAVDVPNVYYQNHLACDEFDVIGFSFPGLPGFPHFGHNGRVAWCITHTSADTQDLFIEKFRTSEDGTLCYLYRDEWKPALVSKEEVFVHGSSPVSVEIISTLHGPVMIGDARCGSAFVLRYTALLGDNKGWNCLLPMMKASSCDEFLTTMKDWVDPVNNLLYASVDGQIGYKTRGHIPVRHPLNGWLPVPGWTGDYDWKGMIPFEGLPASNNPETGYICTANNRVVGKDYPYYIGIQFAVPHRAERISKALSTARSLTTEDMRKVHADIVSRPALDFLSLIHLITPDKGSASEAYTIMLNWDGSMDAGSAAASIYSVTRDELVSSILKPLFGKCYSDAYGGTGRGGPLLVSQVRARIFRQIKSDDDFLLPAGRTWPAVLTESFNAACRYLSLEFGQNPSDWQWGKIHRLNPVHPLSQMFPDKAGILNPASVPLPGDGDTVRAAGYVPVTGYTVTGTSVARYIFDLNDWDNSKWVVPHGASGDPRSPHYKDQNEAWCNCELHPMTYTWEKIISSAASCVVLE